VALARGLDVATVAKGVETPAQLDALLTAGMDYVQGYLIGRPVPNSEICFDSPLLARNVA
jgi:EAL domain-containing protein (putative c-di-GMP-specific phosphodiesterase class I)